MGAVVEVHELTKRYGAARGVDDLNFSVNAGEIFGFLGPNGAGKSTTIRTMLDFQRPTRGSIRLLGLDSRRDSVAIHHRTGYVPGDLQLFPTLTGRAHLDAFARARGNTNRLTTQMLVERFGIELDRPVRELSKGNRQKVGLLLAFMHDPELLVLDEPTAGLDPLMQEQFQQLLRETVASGRTVFLSSHSLDEVQRVASSVALVRDGRLVVTDTIANLQMQAPVRISFRFASPVDPDEFRQLPGVRDVHAHGPELELSVIGSVDPIVKHAARHDTHAMQANPADLEDLFRAYYEPVPLAQATEHDRRAADGG